MKLKDAEIKKKEEAARRRDDEAKRERDRVQAEFESRLRDKDRAMEDAMKAKQDEIDRLQKLAKRSETVEGDKEIVDAADKAEDRLTAKIAAKTKKPATKKTESSSTEAEAATDLDDEENEDSAPRAPRSLGVKMPLYKTGADIEVFVDRFEEFLQIQEIVESKKAKLILSALDDTTYKVATRELTATERKDYATVKAHLLRRFDLLKEKGQRRRILRQMMKKPGQDLASFYTELLGD